SCSCARSPRPPRWLRTGRRSRTAAQLIEFRGAADTLAARIGAGVTAPEVKQALETARELDALCAAADIQGVLHVVAQPGGAFAGDAPPQASGAFGVARRDDGGFVVAL